MNRFYMKARTIVLNTKIGKMLRLWMQKRSYKPEKALAIARKAYGGVKTPAEIDAIVKDMMTEAMKYNLGFDEYVMYHFEDLDQAERRLFIPTRERALYCERLNDPKNQMIFDDKGETYRVFGKYFKRDLTEVVGWSAEATSAFRAFVRKHNRFIIKPFNGGNGRGIRIADCEKEGGFDKLCESLKTQYPSGFVAEELIRQVAELSAVHPDSVNTVRISTIRFDDRVEFLPSFWRVGRGGNCVDNGGSGGILCALDDEGVIISTCDENGLSYDVHPDNQHPLLGFRVPQLEGAKALAAELAQVVPGNRFCGWDLALTDDGWVMQEGNWQGGFVGFQCTLRRGFRKEIDAIMVELGL